MSLDYHAMLGCSSRGTGRLRDAAYHDRYFVGSSWLSRLTLWRQQAYKVRWGGPWRVD